MAGLLRSLIEGCAVSMRALRDVRISIDVVLFSIVGKRETRRKGIIVPSHHHVPLLPDFYALEVPFLFRARIRFLLGTTSFRNRSKSWGTRI